MYRLAVVNSVGFLCSGRFGDPLGEMLLNRVAALLNSAALSAVVGVRDERTVRERMAGVSKLHLVVALLRPAFTTVLNPWRGGLSRSGAGLMGLA